MKGTRAQTAKGKKKVGFEPPHKNQQIDGTRERQSSMDLGGAKRHAVVPKTMEFFVEKANAYEKFK